MANRDLVLEQMGAALVTRTRAEWLIALEEVGVPCGPINSVGEAFSDPQVQSRGMCWEVDHPFRSKLQLVANPIHMSRTPPMPQGPPPLLGQHTAAVLRDLLSFGESEIDELVTQKVVFCNPVVVTS